MHQPPAHRVDAQTIEHNPFRLDIAARPFPLIALLVAALSEHGLHLVGGLGIGST